MKKIRITIIISGICLIPVSLWAQNDLEVGTSYELSLQRKNNHADAFILHNAEYSQANDLLKWKTSHTSFGSRGIRFSYSTNRGIYFYADDVATTAGAEFTPKTRLFIGNHGRIGIGTTEPKQELHIYGTNSYLRIDGTANSGLELYENDNRRWIIDNLVVDDRLRFYSNSEGEVFSILQNGRVGIGIANPETKLHIENGVTKSGTANATHGSLQFAGDYSGDNVLNTYGSQYSSGATCIGYAVKQKNGSGGIVSSAANSSFARGMLIIDSELEFLNAATTTVAINGDVSMTSRFIIDKDGNMGIGTTNPTQKLQVAGTVYSTEVKVELAAGQGPDYVFEPDYELRTLQETKEFITENKHLPEIPSAKEMEANGVELGDMNMRLLKKIEELTLYQIELLERLEKAEQEISQLKNK